MSPDKSEEQDAEIRRLEELNRLDAQRLREPLTTDESPQANKVQSPELRRLQEEETKANCPDEYNLLSATGSQENLDSIEGLRNSADLAYAVGEVSPAQAQLPIHQHKPPSPKEAALNEDLNDRESLASGSDSAPPLLYARGS